MRIQVNGKPVPLTDRPGSFVSLERKWKTGDEVTVSLPMQTKLEYLPDNSSWASVVHGPVVLAAATDTTDLTGLWADGSRMGHVANGPLYPVDEAPVIVSESRDFTSGIKPEEGQPLTFTLSDLIYPKEYRNLELKPFYTIHNTRYILYWPVITPDSLEKRTLAIREKENELLALEARTVDQVAPGEQQPETGHNFRGEGTESGIHEGRYWRHASGWFSYDLNDSGKEGRILRVTYYGMDAGRVFDIFINGILLTTVKSDGRMGSRFFDIDYPISQAFTDSMLQDVMNVKFVAHAGSIAGGIYYVRLIKSMP